MADVLGAKKGQIGPDGQLLLADNAADMLTQQMLNVGQLSQHNSVFEDWMYPEQKEARQNLQQMILDRASYANKMEGMKEAGINPLTAAAGLAGSNAQMPEPASSVNPLGDVAGAANAISGIAPNVANAISTIGTLEPTIDKLRNEAGLAFEQMGLTSAERTMAEASAKYADEAAILDIQTKRVNVKVLAQQYKNLKANHEQILEDINLKIAQAELAGSQEEYYNQLRLKSEEETRWIKADNDFWEQNGFDRHANGNHAIISQMIANGKDPEPYMEKWCQYAGDLRYAESKGGFDADIDTAYKRFYNEFKAKADVDSRFKPYLEKVEAMSDVMKEFAKAMFANPTGNVSGMAFQFLNKMFVLMFGSQLNIDDVNSATRPLEGNAESSGR